jgi:hypothetical protein
VPVLSVSVLFMQILVGLPTLLVGTYWH